MYHVTQDDSVGLSGRAVVLHEMSDSAGAAIDSMATDRQGQYRFVIGSPDITAEYLVSVEHDDIGYFSSVLRLAPSGGDTVPPIVVYDTSSAAPPISLRERHVVIRNEEPDGTRQVIELIALRNDGRFTRIAADTSNPVWECALPPGAFQLAVGESEVGAGAVYFRENKLAVAAPIPPGEKQLLVSYLIPRVNGTLSLPVDQPTQRLTVSIEDTTATLSGIGLVLYGIEDVGGAFLKRYDGSEIAARTNVLVRFETSVVSVEHLKLLLVAAATLVLAGTLTWWLRKQRAATTP